MRGSIVAAMLAIGVAVAPTPAAVAQQDPLGAAATKVYDGCRANQKGSPSECACVAGFFAGVLKEDEFRMLSVITGYIDKDGNVPDMAGAQAAAEAERTKQGMSAARFAEVMERFGTADVLGAYADRVCVPLANKTATSG